MKQKTYSAKASELSADWYLLDAAGLTLGRVASTVAQILKGKHKPTYTPHLNCGDHVIVVNAGRIVSTGRKLDAKVYTRYSGYPHGLKERTLRQAIAIDPTFPLLHAVEGMLQRNSLGAAQLRRLKVYEGAEHRHQAQMPKQITMDAKGGITRGS